ARPRRSPSQLVMHRSFRHPRRFHLLRFLDLTQHLFRFATESLRKLRVERLLHRALHRLAQALRFAGELPRHLELARSPRNLESIAAKLFGDVKIRSRAADRGDLIAKVSMRGAYAFR